MIDSAGEQPVAHADPQDQVSGLRASIDQQEQALHRTAEQIRQLRQDLQGLQRRLDTHYHNDDRSVPPSLSA